MPPSKPSPFRTKKQPIGQLLVEAGLIAKPQLDLALADQKTRYYQDLRLGEILALRGWVSQQTSDFFVSSWQDILDKSATRNYQIKIEKCLYLAGLITRNQILEISQNRTLDQARLSAALLESGYIRQQTLDFFVQNLCVVDRPKQSLQDLIKTKENLGSQKLSIHQRSFAKTLILNY